MLGGRRRGGWSYNGVAELVVSGLVPHRALVSRPGVVEDEERSHGDCGGDVGVREEEATAEGDSAIK